MATSGAQPGNQNNLKGRIWTQAINNVLERSHPKGRMAAMEELAEKLIEGVKAGDLPSIREFGDRMEGKPGQSVDIKADIRQAMVQASDLDEAL